MKLYFFNYNVCTGRTATEIGRTIVFNRTDRLSVHQRMRRRHTATTLSIRGRQRERQLRTRDATIRSRKRRQNVQCR